MCTTQQHQSIDRPGTARASEYVGFAAVLAAAVMIAVAASFSTHEQYYAIMVLLAVLGGFALIAGLILVALASVVTRLDRIEHKVDNNGESLAAAVDDDVIHLDRRRI